MNFKKRLRQQQQQLKSSTTPSLLTCKFCKQLTSFRKMKEADKDAPVTSSLSTGPQEKSTLTRQKRLSLKVN